MLYPTLSDYVNQLHQSRAVATYAEDVDKLTNADYSAYFGAADDFNAQIAAGHLEGTSLPVGGGSTHAVISAHRGLPSAKLFTNQADPSDYELPSTGGAGTKLYTAGGGALMLAALVCGVCKKRKRERRAR